MDRQIVYPGQIPLETDLLNSNKYAMVGLAKLAAAMLGTATVVNGMACVPTGPASLQVVVNPGEMYSLVATDASAYSSLSADAHNILKQGILLDAVTLTCTPPVTAGQSINYLIQAAYQDSDTGSVTLPYYNASNPSQAWSGPNNSGAQQATARKGVVNVSAKAGTAATTGTQTTPAPDAGFTGLWVVTVANGQTTINAGNISQAANAPILAASLLDQILARALLNGDQTKQFSVAPATQSQHAMQFGQAVGRLLAVRQFTANGTYTPTAGTNSVRVTVVGGGGAGGNSAATGSGQVSVSAGGCGGGIAQSYLTSGFSGASMTIGAGGVAGGTADGGTTSFGALLSATGGSAGTNGTAAAPPGIAGALAGGSGSGGNLFNGKGLPGAPGFSFSTTSFSSGGGGGCPLIGAGGDAITNANTNGNAGTARGSGGGGAITGTAAGAFTGGNGVGGIIIVEEFA